MPINNNREYRALSTPLITAGQNKRFDSNYYVEGYATTFDIPYLLYEYDGVKFYEVIAREALAGADVSDVIMQYDHSGKVFARQSNNSLGIEANNKGLFIFADLSKSTAAKELYEEIDSGLITKMSWAFTITEDSYDNQTHTRTIKRIKKVYDVSAVSFPANSDTEISARSFAQGRLDASKQELLTKRANILKLLLEV